MLTAELLFMIVVVTPHELTLCAITVMLPASAVLSTEMSGLTIFDPATTTGLGSVAH